MLHRDGRFDSNRISRFAQYNVYYASDPAKAVPFASLSASAYIEGLLAKSLAPNDAGAKTAAVTAARPMFAVAVEDVRPGSSSSAEVDVLVSITMSGAGFDDGPREVHLLRFDQLVRVQALSDIELAQLRKQKRIELKFEGISLTPFSPTGGLTWFSSLAFAASGRSAASEQKRYTLPPAQSMPKRRAYIVAIGVDRLTNSSWDPPSRIPTYSAHALADALAKRADRSGLFSEVVVVELLSSLQGPQRPTKANIRAVPPEFDTCDRDFAPFLFT